MLYEFLFHLLQKEVFNDRLFRAGASSLFAALIVFLCMPAWIRFLRKMDATSDFSEGKQAPPPIMGGLLLVASVAFSTLAFSHLNAYTVSVLIILIAYSFIGFIDDAIKIRNKRLITLGKLSKADYMQKSDGISARLRLGLYILFSLGVAILAYKTIPNLTGHLTVPFVKPSVWFPHLPNWAFIILMCIVITSTANGANFTDGLDSLVTVPIITTAAFVGLVAYISGNAVFAKYFLIPFMPGVDELFPMATAIIGAMLAYLWFNSPPAEIYMGDAGSIGLGGAIGMMFILVKAALFLPVVGVVFLAEALSVVFQIGGFKITKKFSSAKQGKRLLLCAPLHHHFQKKWAGRHPHPALINSKIVWRFHLVSLLALIVGTLVFFKIR